MYKVSARLESFQRPGKKRQRLIWRIFLWGLVLAALVLPLLGYIAWQQPLSAQWVHDRVLKRLQEAAQVPVAYDSATLRLGRGWYEIKNLQFASSDKSDEPLLRISEVQVRVDPISLLRGSRAFIKSIELTSPTEMDVEYQSTGIMLGPRTRFLADAVQRLQGNGSTASLHLPFGLLTIKDATVRFTEVVKENGESVKASAPAVILGGDLAFSNREGGIFASFSGNGYSPGTGGQVPVAPGIELEVQVARDNGTTSISLDGSAASMSLARLFASAPGSIFAANNLRIESELAYSSAAVTGVSRISCDGVDLAHPQQQLAIHDSDLNLLVKGEYSFNASQLELQELRLDSRQASAAVAGNLALTAPQEFDGALVASKLGPDYRRSLARLLPEGYALQGEDRSLALDVKARGQHSEITALEGNLQVTSMTLQVPYLNRPIQQLGGSVRFGEDKLQILELHGQHGQTSLQLSGELLGPYLKTREGDLTLQWSAVSTSDDLLAFAVTDLQTAKAALPRRRSQNNGVIPGTISGSGTYRQHISLSSPEVMKPPEIDGSVELSNVGLSHPALPMPVEQLNGRLEIAGEKLLIDDLRGSTGVGEVAITGELSGHEVFWKDPAISATLVSHTNLSKVGALLPSEQSELMSEHNLQGQAISTIVFRGPLAELKSGGGLTGNLHLRDAAFDPGLEFMDGTFSNVDAEIRWDGKALRLGRFTGKLNGETVDAAGILSPERIALDLHGRVDLAALDQIFPRVGKLLEMSGPASYSIRFATGDDPLPAQSNGTDPLPGFEESAGAGQISTLLGRVALRLEEAVAEKKYSLSGDVEFEGSNIRHLAMPPARTDHGRSIPRGEVKNMRGKALLEGMTFRVSDENVISCDLSDTKDCRLSGELEIRPDNLPRMALKISSAGELRLDSWITNWGDGLDRPPQPPQTGKRFDLIAEVIAPRTVYKGQRAGRSRATVEFTLIQNNTPRRTLIRNVEIRGLAPGHGGLTGGGEINSFVWNPQQFPKWATRVEVERMPLESLLNSVFSEPTNLSGMASGGIELRGVGKDPARINGGGTATLTNLVIGRTTVMQQVGAATGRSMGGTLFQTAEAARFEIGNGALSSRNLQLQTNGMRLDMRGDYYFAGNPHLGIPERTINGLMRMNFFESVLGRIPLLGEMAQLADRVAGTMLLAFRVSGTADRPVVNAVPLPLFTGALPQN